MASCLVESMDKAAGKSAICAGLGKKLIDRGIKVGYFKPLLDHATAGIDSDCEFFKQAFQIEEHLESLCAPFPPQSLDTARTGPTGLKAKLSHLHGACTKATKGKQEVLVEGIGDVADKTRLALSNGLAESLDAKVLLVVRFNPSLTPSQVISTAKTYGPRLIGVVLNAVPAAKASSAQTLSAAVKKEGIEVLGVIPESRALFAVTVADIARQLEGQVLNNHEGESALVENIMVGALGLDPAIDYFNRKGNKAVVTRGNRADIQLAALETPTSCVVLTGGSKPIQNLMFRAEEKHIPLISVKADTITALSRLEQVFSSARFHDEKKLDALDNLLTQGFDFKTFTARLGLKA